MSDVNIQTFSGKVNVSNNFTVGSGHLFVDTQDNKVGLNTATPNSSLHVNGNAYIATDISFGGILSGNGSGLTSVNSDSGLWAGAGTGNVYLSTSTDNVGIGTSSPGQKLSIYTGSTGTAALSFDRYASGNYRTDIYQNTYGADFRVGYGTYTPQSMLYLKRFSDGAKEVEINGNVGIGGRTVGLLAPLHISIPGTLDYGGYTNTPLDMSQDMFRIGNRIANNPTYDHNEYGIQFGVSGSGNSSIQTYVYDHGTTSTTANYNLLLQPNGGNVGIGTTSPGAKLHVDGSVLTSAASSYNPAIQLGTQTSYNDDQLYSLRWGGSSLMGMGLHSSTRGAFGKQGVAIHIPNTEEFSVKTNGWTNLLAIDGASSQVRLYGSQSYPNRPMAMVGKSNGRVYYNNYVIFNVVGYNDSGMYNSSNGRFTAPYTGYYLFTTTLLAGERETNSNTRWYINGVDTQWGAAHFNMGSGVNMNTTNARNGLSSQMIYYMNAGAYMQLRMVGGSMYGSSQIHSTTTCIFLGSR